MAPLEVEILPIGLTNYYVAIAGEETIKEVIRAASACANAGNEGSEKGRGIHLSHRNLLIYVDFILFYI